MAYSVLRDCLLAVAVAEPPRYWPKFAGNRQVELLDGEWSYGLRLDQSFDSMDPFLKPGQFSTPNKTHVPSCMDVVAGGASGYLGPRGVAMYRTDFVGPSTGHARLQFQSCSFYCRVWVNGKEIGDHRAGGYVAFWLDVPSTALKKGEKNELLVLADNRFNGTTAPMHTGGDFWHYGGLTRSVELHTMADHSVLWRAYVLPHGADLNSPSQVNFPKSVDITLVFSRLDSNAVVSFAVAFDEAELQIMNGTVKNGTLSLKNVPVPNAKLWSTDEPNLHTLKVAYRGGSVIERFGLRSFGVDKATSRLTINGKVQKIVGWNHHTQWPITAASPTDAQIDTDIALLKKGGATYVRGAHYPHDPRVLDRLDEAGMVFWSETLGPGVTVQDLTDWDYFMVYQMKQLEEMLDNALNHASILTWGWFNEAPSDHEDACPAYASCSTYSRARDPTRFVTWADNKGASSKCLSHASLISFNNYPGWYSDAGDLTAPKRTWTEAAAKVRAGTTASGNGTLGKPFVISETGAAGIYEWDHNSSDVKWSLKYQTEIISNDVDVAIQNENISGITLWHFFDFKVNDHEENNSHCIYDHPPPTTFEELTRSGPPNCTTIIVNGRPGGENHKGCLDFWRREKPAFSVVASKYQAVRELTRPEVAIVV